MVKGYDRYKLSSPQVYLWKMIIFLIIAAFIPFILYQKVVEAFLSNVLLNGLIVATLAFGIIFAFRQVISLFPEVLWINAFRTGRADIQLKRPPVLLAPMSIQLESSRESVISPQTNRTLLDSIAIRLDEAREISRYLTGLLVFLGLLGTFWGLLQTVSAVGQTIQSLNVGSGDAGAIFSELKSGLEAPLGGMGTAFSSSLFGLAGSLILGFLDLQAGQAQNRFYTELEDWLSSVTEIGADAMGRLDINDADNVFDQIRYSIEELNKNVQNSGNSRASTTAMANLAEGIQGLVQHMRSEQQIVRSWIEPQNVQQKEISDLLKTIADKEGQIRNKERDSPDQ